MGIGKLYWIKFLINGAGGGAIATAGPAGTIAGGTPMGKRFWGAATATATSRGRMTFRNK